MAQCSGLLGLPTNSCSGDTVTIPNPHAQGEFYNWDFCTGDLKESPDALDFGVIDGIGRTDAITWVEENGIYHVFMATIADELHHLTLNENLDSVTSSENYGNPGGLLKFCTGIRFTNDRGTWKALTINANSGKFIQLNFANGLGNAPTDEIDYGNLGLLNNPKEIDLYRSGNDVAIAISNETGKSITTVFFTDSIALSSMSVSGFNITDNSEPRAVTISKNCNNWDLFVATSSTAYFRFNLGADFTNSTPVQTTLSFNAVTSKRIHAIRDGINHYLIIPTDGGIYKLDFGLSYDNEPTVLNLGTYGFIEKISSFHFQNLNSSIIGFGSSRTLQKLYKIQFPNNCEAPFSSSDNNPDMLVSGNNAQHIFVEVIDSSGNQLYFNDSTNIFRSPEINTSQQLTCTGQTTNFIDLSSSPNGNIVTREWNIDGALSSDSLVSLTFPVFGDVPFSLSIEDPAGCSAQISDTAHIVSADDIKSNFIVPEISCTNTEITFTDSSTFTTDSISGWLWDYGDPLSGVQNISNEQNGSHIFLQSGNYDVQLTAFGQSGCSTTLIKTVAVGIGPTVQFSSEATCFGDTTFFLNTSTGENIIEYKWFFGDGDSLNQESASHLYSSIDTFNVRLEVTNNTGCKSIQSQNTAVIALPVAQFEASVSCSQEPTLFLNNSIIQNDSISEHLWNFDLNEPSAVSTENSPNHFYSFPGEFDAKLVITTEAGCTDSIVKTVKTHACETSLPNGTSLCLNDSLKVTSSPLNDYYQWDFCFGELNGFPVATNFGKLDELGRADAITWVADSGNTYVFLATVSEEFVRLTIPDSTEEIEEVTNLGTLNSLLKLPSGINFIRDNGVWKGFIANANSANITQVVFENGLSQAPTEVIDMGNFGFINNPSDIAIWMDGGDIGMAIPNQFDSTITLIHFADSINGTSTISNLVVNGATNLKGLSLIKTKNEWNVFVSISPTNYLRFKLGSNLKTPSVTSTILDISAPTSRRVHALKDGPNHHLIIPTNLGVYQLKYGDNFDNEPQIINLGDFGFISKVNGFDFKAQNSKIMGFGTNLNTHEVYHVTYDNLPCYANLRSSEDSVEYLSYPTEGKYYIFSDMINADGIQIELYDSIDVLIPPSAAYSSSLTCTEETTQLIDISTSTNGDIINRNWTINTTDTGSDSIYTEEFLNTGPIPITLTVTDVQNCISTISDTILIVDHQDITPAFNFSNPICTYDNTVFTDNSTFNEDPISQWQWQFGDTLSQGSNESADTNGIHTFDVEGTFEITLIVTGKSGCYQDTTMSVQTIAGPSVSFLADERCRYDSVSFIDNSTGNNITDYLWNFGDGTFSTSNMATHKFDSSQTYTVSLTVSNAAGCNNTLEKQHFVYPIPTSEFDVDLSCTNLPTLFYDRSDITSGTIDEWLWDFGTTSLTDTSSDQNTAFVFEDGGQQLVTLVVFSDHNCKDTSTLSVSTLESPQANFEFSDVCLGEFTEFLDFSTSSSSSLQEWLWTVNEKSGTRFYSNQNPAHQFSEPDSFNVVLKITNVDGCSDTSSSEVFIPSLPTPAFDYDASCSNSPISFKNTSVSPFDSIINAAWLFEELGFQNGDTATVSYPTSTVDRVHLTVTTQRGCSAEIIQSVTILSNPVASFSINPIFGEAPLEVTTENSSTNSTDFLWIISDNDDTLSTTSPIFSLNENGDYVITLIALNGTTCRDTNSLSVSVGEAEVDLAITNALPFYQDGNVRFSLTLENNSSIAISNPRLAITWSTNSKINEETNVTLAPGQTLTYNTSLSLDSLQFILEDYFCFNAIIPFTTGLEDTDLSNNNYCMALTLKPNLLSLYPNPAINSTSLTIYSPSISSSTISIFDELGREVSHFDVSLEKGPNKITLNTSVWSSGQYYIMIDSSGNVEMINLLKF